MIVSQNRLKFLPAAFSCLFLVSVPAHAADPSFGVPPSGLLPPADAKSSAYPRADRNNPQANSARNAGQRNAPDTSRNAAPGRGLNGQGGSPHSGYSHAAPQSGYGAGPGYPVQAPNYAMPNYAGSNFGAPPGYGNYGTPIAGHPAPAGYPQTVYPGSPYPAPGYPGGAYPSAGVPQAVYAPGTPVPLSPGAYPPGAVAPPAAAAAMTGPGYSGAVYGASYYSSSPSGSGGLPSAFSSLFASLTNDTGQGPDWSGFYLGATVAQGKSEIQRFWPQTDHWAPAGTQIGQESDGTIGGMVIGFNQQLGGFVVGVDALVLANKFSKTERSPAPSTVGSDPVYINYDLKELYLVTARAGLAIGQFLPYVKAGAAWGRFTTYTHDSDAGGVLHWGDTSEMQTAIVWGGGVEMLIGQNLVLGVEYTRIDFQPHTHYLSTVSGTGIAAPVWASSDVSAKMDLITARLALKFPPITH